MDDSVCPWSTTVAHPLVCILCGGRGVLLSVSLRNKLPQSFLA